VGIIPKNSGIVAQPRSRGKNPIPPSGTYFTGLQDTSAVLYYRKNSNRRKNVLGRWNFTSEPREGKTPQTQPPVETKEKEYTRRLTRRGNPNVLAHFSSIRVFTVVQQVRYFPKAPQARIIYALVGKLVTPRVTGGR